MNIDVEKLINQVSKHPEIYNPDHKDFFNDEVRDNIFNTSISKEMSGIKGQILHRKWDQILNKYASFIRKLSNDDSSETVLERFMEWPWTKQMRIFKPYVRKQFQIPEFQAAVQIPEMDPDDLPDVPLSMFELAMRMPEFAHLQTVPGPTDYASGTAEATEGAAPHQVRLTPAFVRNLFAAAPDGGHMDDQGRPTSVFHHIAIAMGLDQPSDGDETTDSDEETDGDGLSAAKRRRRCHREDGTAGDADVLPDLPVADERPSDITAHEPVFLAWAKMMSTFTAERQATIKMQINKIMSEAEFEDLDDEFFAANKPSQQPIHTSRL